MPYVNIKITDEYVSREQIEQLIRGATRLLVETLDKDPATTHVIVDIIPTDNWGVFGQSVTTLRRKE